MADGRRREELTDHDLLIRLDERVEALEVNNRQRFKKLDECLGNHLQHHSKVTIGVIVAAASAMLSMIVMLLTKLVK